MRIFLTFCLIVLMAGSQNLPRFPRDFLWGVASSSYQVEGAYNSEGRGASVWDTFSKSPNKTFNGSTGDIAANQYFKMKEDVQLIASLGIKVYSFSISWSRILPLGKGAKNQKGINFYNALIGELLSSGITPFITLFHWDLPQQLEDDYNGFLDSKIVGDFVNFADLCFQSFGDRVKLWSTFHSPNLYAVNGYYYGIHAPGRCSNPNTCGKGDSNVEPYVVAHNILNTHASVVLLYRTKYQKDQNGKIGISIYSDWNEARNSSSPQDNQAAQRLQEFQFSWFADPILKGDYPNSMKSKILDRLPKFTSNQTTLINGSADFLGINHYTSRFVTDGIPMAADGYLKDSGCITFTVNMNGTSIGLQAFDWLYVVPWGFSRLLNWVKDRYSIPVFITENGLGLLDESQNDSYNDTSRVDYFKLYVTEMSKAMDNNTNVKGYFIWSFLDGFEWEKGYSVRFGINYVQFTQNQTRSLKSSAEWWKNELSIYTPIPFYRNWAFYLLLLVFLYVSVALAIVTGLISWSFLKKHLEPK